MQEELLNGTSALQPGAPPGNQLKTKRAQKGLFWAAEISLFQYAIFCNQERETDDLQRRIHGAPENHALLVPPHYPSSTATISPPNRRNGELRKPKVLLPNSFPCLLSVVLLNHPTIQIFGGNDLGFLDCS